MERMSVSSDWPFRAFWEARGLDWEMDYSEAPISSLL